MECSLSKKLKSEHARKDEPRYSVFLNCPLINGKQICLWCCLHICDIAEPLGRGDSAALHPTYESVVAKETDRDWDEIWYTCSRCSKG